jgi:hypothetical protein
VIERPVAAGLLALPILYVTALLLPAFPVGAVGVAVAFAVSFLIALLTGFPQPAARDLGAWVGIAFSVFFALAVWAPGTFGDAPAAMAGGVLLGLPWIAWAYVWRERESLANRMVAYAVSITVGVLLLATLDVLRATGSSVTPDSFVSAFYSLNVLQVQGIVTVLSGAGPTDLPAHDVFDAIYVALTGISVLGVLLLVARPRTGDGRSLPIALASYRDELPGGELSPLLGFSEAQRATFRERSFPVSPASAAPPGLTAVLIASLATASFLVVAFLLPFWALLAGVGGLVGSVVLLAATADIRYRAESEGGPAHSAPKTASPEPPATVADPRASSPGARAPATRV